MKKITLPEKIDGYEIDADYKHIENDDIVLALNYTTFTAIPSHAGQLGLVLTPERKVMSWYNTDGNILVHPKGCNNHYMKTLDLCPSPSSIWIGRQPHILGDKCPVDPKACYVLVMHKNGVSYEGPAHKLLDWSEVMWFQVLRLVEGYEYE